MNEYIESTNVLNNRTKVYCLVLCQNEVLYIGTSCMQLIYYGNEPKFKIKSPNLKGKLKFKATKRIVFDR